MVRFVFHKLLSKKWMVLALILGNVLLLSLSAATAVYTDTALQRALELRFQQDIRENNRWPMQMTEKSARVSKASNELLVKEEIRLGRTGEDLKLPMHLQWSLFTLSTMNAESSVPRGESGVRFTVSAMTDLWEHVDLKGEQPTHEINEDGTINGWLPEWVMKKQRLSQGEVLTFKDQKLPSGEELKIRVAGSFTMKDTEDPYWVDSPADSTYRISLFIDIDLFRELFLSDSEGNRVSAEFVMLYDYTNIRVADLDRLMRVTDALDKYVKTNFVNPPEFSWKSYLSEFQVSAKKVRTTYLVLQVPVYVLLLLFIFMVASRMIDNEESEIAVLSSRGVGKGQILLIYLIQSIFLTAVGYGIAILLTVPLTKLLSSANGFLEFIRRKDLRVEMNREAFFYAGIGAAASVLSMVLPAFRFAGKSVIEEKAGKRRRNRNLPVWHRFFIDIALLLVALYGLYSFNSRKSQLMEEVILGNALDPLLFLSTAVFMAGAGLLLLRLIPYLEMLIFRIGRKRWSPALYASHCHILGTRREQGFIMLFLTMTVATGIFNAAAARTISENDRRNIRYMNGADLVVRERWDNSGNHAADGPDSGGSGALVFYEPNFDKYERLPGFSSVTKVIDEPKGTVVFNSGRTTLKDVRIMGVEPKKFGETAEFDASLMPVHWYRFLNVLASRKDALVLSSNFKALGLAIGDTVNLTLPDLKRTDSVKGTIYGFVDYWPGYNSKSYKVQSDNSVREIEEYFVLGRFDTMMTEWNTIPYEVWLKTDELGSTGGFYEMADQRGLRSDYVYDTEARILAEGTEAIKQGTSGIFTVSFIVSLTLSVAGFLIYWISSVKNRELQFGVLRAMGMRFSEIIVMLLNEQFFVSVLSIGAGYLVGRITALLYMPILRIAYSSADSPVPLLVVREARDELRLFIIVGLMISAGLMILAAIVRRMRIAEALKLGED